jgi:hypothetical protein
MDNRDTIVIDDDADLERITTLRWADEHGDVRVVGFKSPPVISKGVDHVVICHAVFAGRWLDVHDRMLPTAGDSVNKC